MWPLSWVKRYNAWERDLQRRGAAVSQDRQLAAGLEEGCFFCQIGPWAWAYPMKRAERDQEGGEYLFPAWLPVCQACHDDLDCENRPALEARLAATNPGRRGVRMRAVLPSFLAASAGLPQSRAEAPHLVRNPAEGDRK
jgi:hypothetical protein